MAFILALLEALFGHLIGQEVTARWPKLTGGLIAFAVRRLPEFHRAEKEEEWQSLLADIPGPISKLFQCIDLVRAADVIASNERKIADRRDRTIAWGSLQVLLGAGLIWFVERAERLPLVHEFRLTKRPAIHLLTFMVHGYCRHLEAELLASEQFAEVGNDDLAKHASAKVDALKDAVLNRIVELSLIRAFGDLARDGTIKPDGTTR